MRRIIPIICLLSLFFQTGCWNENLSDCWKTDVAIHIYAEKFQANRTDQLEDVLSTRIRTIRYFLYRDGELMEHGLIDKPEEMSGPFYTFKRNILPFGDYQLALFANAEGSAVLYGDTSRIESLMIVHPGANKGEDYFSTLYSFTVDCDCGFESDVVLYRSHGVTLYEFENLPDNITEIEVGINKVGAKLSADTTACEEAEVSYRVAVNKKKRIEKFSFVVGTFPTLDQYKSSLNLKMYMENDPNTVVYDRLITDTVTIRRNNLLKVVSTFSEEGILGNVVFGISINPLWDDVNNGDIEIQ